MRTGNLGASPGLYFTYMRPMTYPLLALLALPLLAASCGDQGTKLPDDPVALAQALGEFGLYKGFYWSDDPEAGGYTWVYSPKDLNASQGGC